MGTEVAKTEPLHALVAVTDQLIPDVRALLDFLKRTWPNTHVGAIGREGPEGAVLTIELEDERALLAFSPGPIPAEELVGPVAAAWYWPAAAEAFGRQRGHVTVTLAASERGTVERALLLSRLVAAVVATSNAVGVLWVAGALVHEPLDFVETVRRASDEALPLNLWVHFGTHDAKGVRTLFTIGLENFGFREIEARTKKGPKAPPGELVQTVFTVAHYLVLRGATIKEGETIAAAGHRFTAKYEKSVWEREGDVLVLELD